MFDKIVKNDPSCLEEQRVKLGEARDAFGDVNLHIINTINDISEVLVGDRKNYVCENTFRSIHKIQSAIATIDDMTRYLSDLKDALEDYLSYSFQEV